MEIKSAAKIIGYPKFPVRIASAISRPMIMPETFRKRGKRFRRWTQLAQIG